MSRTHTALRGERFKTGQRAAGCLSILCEVAQRRLQRLFDGGVVEGHDQQVGNRPALLDAPRDQVRQVLPGRGRHFGARDAAGGLVGVYPDHPLLPKHDLFPAAGEARPADGRPAVRDLGPGSAGQAYVGVGKRDRERRFASERDRPFAHGVVAGDPALVHGFMQHRTDIVDVAGDEHRQSADLHRPRVADGQAALVALRPEPVETQPLEVRDAPHAEEHPVDGDPRFSRFHPQPAVLFLDVHLGPQMDRQIAPENLDRRAIDLRVLNPADAIQGIETCDVDPHARQGLTDLEPDGPQPDDRHVAGQGLLLEYRVRGEDAVPETLPLLGHQRSRAGGDDDAPCPDLVPLDPQEVRRGELAVPCDEFVPQGRDDVVEDAAHEVVPELSQMRQ